MIKAKKVRTLIKFKIFMTMRKGYGLLLLLIIIATGSIAQDVPLFQSQEPVKLRASGSIKSIKKNSNDSTLVPGKFEYEKTQGEWVTVPVQSRVRGNFRLKNCYFPPLKLKFNKKDVAATLFAGNKAL